MMQWRALPVGTTGIAVHAVETRDPLDDASTDLQRAIAEIHDLLREAKTAKDQGRQGAIYYRVVTLQGFLNALVIDARRDLDALKDLPL